jgi:hypothetical protein
MQISERRWTIYLDSLDGRTVVTTMAGHAGRVIPGAIAVKVVEAEPATPRGAVDPEELQRVAIAIYEARVHATVINGWDAEPEALRERFEKAARGALNARGAV